MTRLRNLLQANQRTLLKTGSYYCIHIVVAACVAYVVTRNFWAALTLSLLEPTVQALAYFLHEKAWSRRLDLCVTPTMRDPKIHVNTL